MQVKSPVLLVHGFKTRAIISGSIDKRLATEDLKESVRWHRGLVNEFGELPEWLSGDGFSVYLAGYQSSGRGAPGAEDCAEILRNQIMKLARKSPTGKLIIIAHSFGGLVVRAYIDSNKYIEDKKKHKGDLVETVFMVGTPNGGAPFLDFLQLVIAFKKSGNFTACEEICDQNLIKRFNEKYKHINQVPYYAIGGAGGESFLGKLLSAHVYLWGGENDSICTVKSATDLLGVKQKAVVYGSHGDNLGRSYYQAEKGKKYSSLYEKCIRPVIVFGNEFGCVGESYVKMKRNRIFLGVARIAFRMLALILLVRLLKYRGQSRSLFDKMN